ncbi:hypothetical protein [Peribacillus sp. SI8-4]|uniref:hypothetical protein n=1 Tax=Peribacillus sp. SI8-4 TaxID=3048009 RepID=UPI0025556948|nr:hypothetical protein [Peribacillus sp. SI8-4]
MEISFFPREKVITVPVEEATYPFEINGEFPYIVDFFCDRDSDHPYFHENFFCSWMDSLNHYPIYSLAEIHDFQQAEYEELFKRQNIAFHYMQVNRKDRLYVKATIRSPQQFNEYYPYLYGNGGMLNLSLWSLKHDVFGMEQREYESPYPVKRTKKNRTRLFKLKWMANTPIVTLTEGSTLFWVGYDGDYITALSNDERFATKESLQQMIPEKVELIMDVYDYE